MLDDPTISKLKKAVSAVGGPVRSAGLWDAIEPLSELARSGHDFTIDLKASDTLGAPVILARKREARADLFRLLTPRQRQVADLVATGHANKQIARELEISPATVKDHVHAILSRLGLRSRQALAAAMHSPQG